MIVTSILIGSTVSAFAKSKVYAGDVFGTISISVLSDQRSVAKNIYELGASIYGELSCGSYNCPDFVVKRVPGQTIQQLGKSTRQGFGADGNIVSLGKNYGVILSLNPQTSAYRLNADSTELLLTGEVAQDLIRSGLAKARGVSCQQASVAVCRINLR